ncbi:hypothetical protein [Lacticaseibacillus saniviri]
MKKLWFGLLVVLVGILMTPAARVAASGAVHDDVGILTKADRAEITAINRRLKKAKVKAPIRVVILKKSDHYSDLQDELQSEYESGNTIELPNDVSPATLGVAEVDDKYRIFFRMPDNVGNDFENWYVSAFLSRTDVTRANVMAWVRRYSWFMLHHHVHALPGDERFSLDSLRDWMFSFWLAWWLYLFIRAVRRTPPSGMPEDPDAAFDDGYYFGYTERRDDQ